MKRIGIALCITATFWACNQQRGSEDIGAVEEGDNTEVLEAGVTDVLSVYMNLKDALVQTDFEATKEAGRVFEEVTKGNVDAAYEKALISITRKIIAAQDVEAQRVEFEQVSVLMYALAENGQFETVGKTIYKQYCPMAFESRGAYWLSMDESILNPYFGNRMLNCGYTEKTL